MNENQRLIAKILELKSSNSTTRFDFFFFKFNSYSKRGKIRILDVSINSYI